MVEGLPLAVVVEVGELHQLLLRQSLLALNGYDIHLVCPYLPDSSLAEPLQTFYLQATDLSLNDEDQLARPRHLLDTLHLRMDAFCTLYFQLQKAT